MLSGRPRPILHYFCSGFRRFLHTHLSFCGFLGSSYQPISRIIFFIGRIVFSDFSVLSLCFEALFGVDFHLRISHAIRIHYKMWVSAFACYCKRTSIEEIEELIYGPSKVNSRLVKNYF